MHLAFVLPLGEYYSAEWAGAIATITRHLAGELQRSGHTVTIIAPDDGNEVFPEGNVLRLRHGSAHPMPTLLRKANTAHARLKGWTWHDYGPYLRGVTRALRSIPDPIDAIVVANDPGTADRLADAGLSKRTVLWLHNRLEGAETRPFASLSDRVAVVAVSQAVVDWTSERYLPSTPITVIHSGVDHERFLPRSDYLEVRDPVRVITHGRIDPNKGHEVAAAAVARLRQAGLPVEITLIGAVRTFGYSAEDAAAYADSVRDAMESADGTMLGWMPHEELAEQIRQHDVACVLSRVDEPFPLTSLEAMASGCAIIAARKGGIPEGVGNAGALVDADAPDQVAAVLEGWVRDRGLLTSMKRAAAERAGEFTWSATASALLRILDD
ncbi:glycosyltransferase family 4 protein [Agromyces bracchium]|uniref:D-inositol 3-phosphate glycosyltransferase n=1 Tax=Agromyces bracchium TaxID=88376 RepID=A0A6I3LZY6_9MICO|nr:glycosyltransferase family 4 protein [Agromyces bracchium]MTH66909.1 glycosyltransferase [Agromyces bracchium]